MFLSVWVWAFFETAPISIGYFLIKFSLSFGGRTYIDQSSSCQFEFKFSSWDRTYIDQSSSVSVWAFGVAPILIDHLPISLCLVWVFRDRTYIDRSFILSVQLEFRDCTYIDKSFILSLGPHLYRSIIHLISSVRIGTAPILIGHFHEISILGVAPISIGHLPVSLSLSFRVEDYTYIDRSFSCQFEFRDWTYIDRLLILSCQFCLSFGTAPISIGHLPANLVWVFEDRTYIDRSFSCQFEFSRLYLYRLTIFLSVWVWLFELRIAPISIGHFRVSLCFWDCTYINRPSSCQFEFWDQNNNSKKGNKMVFCFSNKSKRL